MSAITNPVIVQSERSYGTRVRYKIMIEEDLET